MKHLGLLFATALIALIFACGGTETAPDEPTRGDGTGTGTEAASPAPSDGLYDACKAVMEKSRACTDDYIPALVDMRIELDLPAGTKADAETEGRDALIAKAMEEWKGDSTDEAFEKQCTNVNDKMPAEHREKSITVSNECAAKDACSDFVACIMPLQKEMFQVRL